MKTFPQQLRQFTLLSGLLCYGLVMHRSVRGISARVGTMRSLLVTVLGTGSGVTSHRQPGNAGGPGAQNGKGGPK